MAETWQHRTMRDILRILFTRWLSSLVILVAVVAVVVAVTLYQPKVYEAKVTLLVPVTETDTKLAGEIRSDSIWEVVLKTQHEILMSDVVLSRALVRASKDRSLPRQGRYGLETLRDPKSPESLGNDPINREAEDIRKNYQDKLAELKRNVRMEVPGGQTVGKSQVFTIYVRANDPDRAQRLADMIKVEFIFRYHELVISMLRTRWESAQTNEKQLLTKYEDMRKQYSSFLDQSLSTRAALAKLAQLTSMIRGPSADVGDAATYTQARQKLTEMEGELARITKFREELKNALENISKPTDVLRVMPYVPDDVRLDNPSIAIYGEALARKYGRQIELEEQYSDTYQELVQVRGEIKTLAEELKSVLEAVGRLMEVREQQLTKQAEVYRNVVNASTEKTGETKSGELLTRLNQFQTEWTTLQDQRKERLDQLNRAETDYETALGAAKIEAIDDANRPNDPIRPIIWLNLSIGLVLGLLLSLTYAFLADFYDHTVRSTDDVERYLGVPVLTSVRKMRKPIRR